MDNKKLEEAARESSRMAYIPKIFSDGLGRIIYEWGFHKGAKWSEEQETKNDANNIFHRDETPAWAARDRNGKIYLYFIHKPVKDEVSGNWVLGGVNGGLDRLDPDMFPQVKWEDPTPTPIVMITTTVYRIKEN